MSFPINCISPKLLNDKSISSWFTLSNQEHLSKDRLIPGLNLGLNTDETAERVLQNRQMLMDHIEQDPNLIAYAEQVHGTLVKSIDAGGIFPEMDGFVTNKKGIALAIQVADCAAVLLGDPVHEVIGAAHAGWRGAAGHIVSSTIHEMKALGANPSDIRAYISPCISLKNFEVGEEVAARFPAEFVDEVSYSKPHVDLKAFIVSELEKEGVLSSNIETDEHCTVAEKEFYSYRRQKDRSGRMMGIIRLNEKTQRS